MSREVEVLSSKIFFALVMHTSYGLPILSFIPFFSYLEEQE